MKKPTHVKLIVCPISEPNKAGSEYDPNGLSEQLFHVDTIHQAEQIYVARSADPQDEKLIPGTRFCSKIDKWTIWYLTPITFEDFANQFIHYQ